MNNSRNSNNTSGLIFSFILALPALLAGVHGYKYFSQLGAGSWQSTDWYISYDFGFVRRGLLGGPLRIAASKFDWLNINIFLLFLTIFAVISITILLIIKTKNINFSARAALAFSPAFYPVFLMWDPQGGGRKEALAIIFIMVYMFLASKKNSIWKKARLLMSLLVLPLLILAHESVFFFAVPILIFATAIDWINDGRNWSKGISEIFPLLRSLVFLIPSFIALLAAFLYSKPPVDQVEAICRSWQIAYQTLVCTPLPAALDALAGTGRNYFKEIVDSYNAPLLYGQWLLAFGYVIALTVACLVPLVNNRIGRMSLNIRYAISSLLLGLCGIVAVFSIALYALAIDYGRWMSVSVTLILVTCLLYQEKIRSAAIVLSPVFAQKSFPLLDLERLKWVQLALVCISGFVMVPNCCINLWQLNFLIRRVA